MNIPLGVENMHGLSQARLLPQGAALATQHVDGGA